MATKHKLDASDDAPPSKVQKPEVLDDFHAALSLLDDPALGDAQPSTSKEPVSKSAEPVMIFGVNLTRIDIRINQVYAVFSLLIFNMTKFPKLLHQQNYTTHELFLSHLKFHNFAGKASRRISFTKTTQRKTTENIG